MDSIWGNHRDWQESLSKSFRINIYKATPGKASKDVNYRKLSKCIYFTVLKTEIQLEEIKLWVVDVKMLHVQHIWLQNALEPNLKEHPQFWTFRLISPRLCDSPSHNGPGIREAAP